MFPKRSMCLVFLAACFLVVLLVVLLPGSSTNTTELLFFAILSRLQVMTSVVSKLCQCCVNCKTNPELEVHYSVTRVRLLALQIPLRSARRNGKRYLLKRRSHTVAYGRAGTSAAFLRGTNENSVSFSCEGMIHPINIVLFLLLIYWTLKVSSKICVMPPKTSQLVIGINLSTILWTLTTLFTERHPNKDGRAVIVF